MNIQELIRKIEIHVETTEECIDNFNLDEPTKNIIRQDIAFLNEIKSEITEWIPTKNVWGVSIEEANRIDFTKGAGPRDV